MNKGVNMSSKSVHFSSERQTWETPQDLFDALNKKFNFDIDVCALPDNAKCKIYFTPEIERKFDAKPY